MPFGLFLQKVFPAFTHGICITASLVACAFLIGVPIASATAAALLSRSVYVRWAARVVVTLIRSIPVLCGLLFAYYIIPSLWNITTSPFTTAVIVLGVHFAAFLSDILRSAFLSVSDKILEQGVVLGMSRRQLFTRIVCPQVARHATPGAIAVTLALFKYSSIASVIGVFEIMHQADFIALEYARPVESYLVATFCYALIIVPVSAIADTLAHYLDVPPVRY